MTNSKMTRRALLTSIMALVLCFAMLTGTTFAWFTDQETSANNKIIAGNLDVEIEYWSGTEWKTIKGASDILTNTLYEPGATEVAYLRISNVGTLALKYQVAVNIASEKDGVNVAGNTFKLSDYIMYDVIDDVNGETNAYATREAAIAAVTDAKKISEDYNKTGEIQVNGNAHYIALVVYMPTAVDNVANHNGTDIPEINLGVSIVATQLMAEEDAFGPDYDKDAVAITKSNSVNIPAASEPATEQTLETPIENGATVTLPAELISGLAQAADAPQTVALSHSEPRINSANNTVKFDSFELVDENGDVIDLEALGNDKPITVKFNVGNAFDVNDIVIVYHDDELIGTSVVDADKNITYTATHFCEVTVGYNDGKLDDISELAIAVKNAKDGDTIVFGGDITSEDGILIENKNLTIDLKGYTFSVSEGASVSNRNIKVIGSSVVTVKNGTLIADGTTTSGAYGTIRTEGTAKVTLENLKLYNYRGGGLNVKAVTGTNVTINNCEIYSQYGGGVEASGGAIVLNDTKIEQKGVYTNGWYSVAMEINSSGKITVNSGEYSGSAIATDANAAMGNCVAFILSSGGTLEINGGTFNAIVSETANASNFCGVIYADRAAVVNIYGGTFNSNGAILDMRNNAGSQPNPTATLYGGTFSANPTVSGLYSSNLIKVAEGNVLSENGDGTWTVAFDGVVVESTEDLVAALASGKNIMLASDVSYDSSIVIADGVTFDGNGKTVKYNGTEYTYHLVKLSTGAEIKNVNFEDYRVRTESTTNGTVTLTDVVIHMNNNDTGLDISRGAGTAKLTNVTCKSITDAAHLDPSTTVQVDYTPYGDVLLGGAWALEADGCEFGSLHGWNTRNSSNVRLNDTTCTVFRMHYWSNRTLYVNGVETAWSESGAIPVAHDVGGCWSVQPEFK